MLLSRNTQYKNLITRYNYSVRVLHVFNLSLLCRYSCILKLYTVTCDNVYPSTFTCKFQGSGFVSSIFKIMYIVYHLSQANQNCIS